MKRYGCRNCTQLTQSMQYHRNWGELCRSPARGSGHNSPQSGKTAGERRIEVSYDTAVSVSLVDYEVAKGGPSVQADAFESMPRQTRQGVQDQSAVSLTRAGDDLLCWVQVCQESILRAYGVRQFIWCGYGHHKGANVVDIEVLGTTKP